MIVIEVTADGVEAFGDLIPGQEIDLHLPKGCYRITRWGATRVTCREATPSMHEMPQSDRKE